MTGKELAARELAKPETALLAKDILDYLADRDLPTGVSICALTAALSYALSRLPAHALAFSFRNAIAEVIKAMPVEGKPLDNKDGN